MWANSGWNPHAWSLTLEFTAYLIFPFLLPPIWRAGGPMRLAVAAAMAAAVVAVALRLGGELNAWDGPMTLLRCVPQFVLGAMLHDIWRSGWRQRFWSRDATLGLALLATALMLHRGAPDLLFPPLFLVVILAAAHNAGRLSEVATWRPLVWLAMSPSSLYLLHGLVQYVATRGLEIGFDIRDTATLSTKASFVLLAMMLAASLGLAGLSYRHIEVGGRRWLRRRLDVPSSLVQPKLDRWARNPATAITPLRPIRYRGDGRTILPMRRRLPSALRFRIAGPDGAAALFERCGTLGRRMATEDQLHPIREPHRIPGRGRLLLPGGEFHVASLQLRCHALPLAWREVGPELRQPVILPHDAARTALASGCAGSAGSGRAAVVMVGSGRGATSVAVGGVGFGRGSMARTGARTGALPCWVLPH